MMECCSSGKFLVVESGFQGLGIPNPSNDWNPESKLHCQCLTRAGIQYLDLESAAWNHKSKTVSDFLVQHRNKLLELII